MFQLISHRTRNKLYCSQQENWNGGIQKFVSFLFLFTLCSYREHLLHKFFILPSATMFLHLSLCPQGGPLSACWDTTPPGAGTPRDQTPNLGPDTPTLPEQAPPRDQTPPQSRPPSRQLRLRTVRILLECILVNNMKITNLCTSNYFKKMILIAL